MRVLVIYDLLTKADRNTINEHLYSFRNFSSHQVNYLNVAYPIPSFLSEMSFDVVIFHYTLLDLRNREGWFEMIKNLQRVKNLAPVKIAIPQDEYVNTDLLNIFFKEMDIKYLATCLPESEWQKVYDTKISGVTEFTTVLTGYVDENAVKKLKKYVKPHSERMIDVGYRARKLPYSLGRHGMIKWKLTDVFKSYETTLKMDISNNAKDVFLGEDWYHFLSDCRVTLGCEGGSSLLDKDGELIKKTAEFEREYPKATFEDTEENCFKGMDGNLKLFAISPRHFEACITKTCQALVEGEYAGIFKPNVHYIEIKKDWSNVNEVIAKIKDLKYCEAMAERAFDDIINSNKYTYRLFVEQVFSVIGNKNLVEKNDISEERYNKLDRIERFPFLCFPVFFIKNQTMFYLHLMLVKLKLINIYRNIRAKFVTN